MQIQQSALTLFDYISNSTQSDNALQSAVSNQKNNIYAEITGVQSNLASGNIDDALARLKSGENGLNLQTFRFNLRCAVKSTGWSMASQ